MMNEQNYLFITYIVTSKPKRISVAAGFVHIVFLLKLYRVFTLQLHYFKLNENKHQENHEKRACVLSKPLSST